MVALLLRAVGNVRRPLSSGGNHTVVLDRQHSAALYATEPRYGLPILGETRPGAEVVLVNVRNKRGPARPQRGSELRRRYVMVHLQGYKQGLTTV